MRAMLDPRQSTSISVIENDFEKHSKIDTQKLSQTTTMEEFINCLKGTIYELSETQRRMIEDLKLQTKDLSLRESFERFVGIFFPKN